jgi:hypothetical protein
MFILRCYEGDTGDNPTIPAVETVTPPPVIHTIQTVPETPKEVAEVPHQAINDTLLGLTEATRALTEAANKLGEKATPVVAEPIEATQNAPQVVAEVQPDITLPPPETRYVRRNGRKVKR